MRGCFVLCLADTVFQQGGMHQCISNFVLHFCGLPFVISAPCFLEHFFCGLLNLSAFVIFFAFFLCIFFEFFVFF